MRRYELIAAATFRDVRHCLAATPDGRLQPRGHKPGVHVVESGAEAETTDRLSSEWALDILEGWLAENVLARELQAPLPQHVLDALALSADATTERHLATLVALPPAALEEAGVMLGMLVREARKWRDDSLSHPLLRVEGMDAADTNWQKPDAVTARVDELEARMGRIEDMLTELLVLRRAAAAPSAPPD